MKAERRRYVRQVQGWLWGKSKTETPAIEFDLFHIPRAVMSNEQNDLRYRLTLKYHSQGISIPPIARCFLLPAIITTLGFSSNSVTSTPRSFSHTPNHR